MSQPSQCENAVRKCLPTAASSRPRSGSTSSFRSLASSSVVMAHAHAEPTLTSVFASPDDSGSLAPPSTTSSPAARSLKVFVSSRPAVSTKHGCGSDSDVELEADTSPVSIKIVKEETEVTRQGSRQSFKSAARTSNSASLLAVPTDTHTREGRDTTHTKSGSYSYILDEKPEPRSRSLPRKTPVQHMLRVRPSHHARIRRASISAGTSTRTNTNTSYGPPPLQMGIGSTWLPTLMRDTSEWITRALDKMDGTTLSDDYYHRRAR